MRAQTQWKSRSTPQSQKGKQNRMKNVRIKTKRRASGDKFLCTCGCGREVSRSPARVSNLVRAITVVAAAPPEIQTNRH